MKLTNKEIAVVLKLLNMGVKQQRVADIFDIGVRQVRLLKVGQRRNDYKDYMELPETFAAITIVVSLTWLDQMIKCLEWYRKAHKHTAAESKRVGFYLSRLKLTRAEAAK